MKHAVAAAFFGICLATNSYAKEPVETKVETLQADPSQSAASADLTLIAEKGSFVAKAASDRKALGGATNDLRACGMVWDRDQPGQEGLYSVWRPTRPTAIVVNLTRKGKLVGSTTINVRPPSQEISLLINRDGLNHDGVHSCFATL